MTPRPAFLRQQLVPAVVFFGLAYALAHAPWVQRIEDVTLDFRTRFRATHQDPPDPRVAVIGVDDDSLQRFGRWQDWPRRNHGLLLHALAAAPEKPAVVGWDILFPEPSADDEHLVDGAAALPGRVIFAAYASNDAPLAQAAPDELSPDLTQPITRIEGDAAKLFSAPYALLPVAPLRAVGLTAFVDTPAGHDGVRRTVPLLVRVKDRVYASLALQCALRFWNLTVADVRVRPGEAIFIEGKGVTRRIPIDEAGRFFVNYRHNIADYLARDQAPGHAQIAIAFHKKYVERADPGVTLPNLGGKIALVGLVAPGLPDNGPTPLSPETPLVFVQANIVGNILGEDYARPANPFWVWGLALAIGVAGVRWLSDKRLRSYTSFSIGVPAIFAVVAFIAWQRWSVAIPLVAPVLGFGSLQIFVIGRRVLSEQRKREEVQGMFGTYVSPAVVDRLVKSGEPPRLGGHESEITAYFSDIQGFSRFSEQLPPDRLVELMNEYLTACTDVVTDEGGTLDKYIGDAVVAMFGAPIALPDHAYRACLVALRVQRRLAELREKWRAEGDRWPSIVWEMQTRIGLNSGPCVIGNMGSRTRFNYTMMGDNVNLASRMESGAKRWGVFTLCTQATKVACERDAGDRLVFRSLGKIRVVGRGQAVGIFELVGLKEEMSAATRECLAKFDAALARYHARDWPAAIAGFEASAALEPYQPGRDVGVASNPSLVFAKLARGYADNAPAAGWDGTHDMREK
ncbi:MAG: adenylate/guanylate cyclase domain-containing protein [Opitutaceae bacterium]|nr:adenylate/guanylate cyclase domain-containing protein [Opitutaceae bacterium]